MVCDQPIVSQEALVLGAEYQPRGKWAKCLSSSHAELVLGVAREGSKTETESTQDLLSSRLRTGQFHFTPLVKASHEINPENRPYLLTEGAVEFYHNYSGVKIGVHSFAHIYKHLLCAGHYARPD